MAVTVETARSHPPTGPDLRPFATKGVLAIAMCVALGHLIASADGEYWFDEAYMLSLGRGHLDWGFVDQPPLVPLLSAFMDWLGSGSMIVLRLPAVVATAATVVVAALIARELGGDRRAQLLTAVAQSGAIWITLTGHWMTPYTFEPFVWAVATWLLVRWIRLRDDRLLLLLGLAAGVGAQTKFQVLLLCAILLITVATLGPRELLRRPLLWGGVGIALLCAAPTLLWQATHGWPQLEMASVVAGETGEGSGGGKAAVAVLLIVAAGIAGTVLVLIGLWTLLRDTHLRPFRFLGVAFVLLYLLFVITGGRLYYLGGMYPVAIAAGAVALNLRRNSGKTRASWVAWPAAALSAATAIAMLVASTVNEPRSVWGANLAGVRSSAALTAETAEAYRNLPDETRDRTAVLGETFIIAAYLDMHHAEHGLPSVYSTNRGYGLLEPPPASARHALVVGDTPGEFERHFTSARQLGVAGAEGAPKIWLLRDRTADWSEIWEHQRGLVL